MPRTIQFASELDRINAERRKRNLPSLSVSDANSALRDRSPPDDTAVHFLISYGTGVPMPSAGGLSGFALHNAASDSSWSSSDSGSSSSSDSGSSSSSFD